MMRQTIAILLLVAAGGHWPVEVPAHHGGALYDSTQTVTVRGPVTNFHFVFPHTLVYIAVAGENGDTVEWSGELTTPNRLARGIAAGAPSAIKWTANSLLPGDVIELTGSPARNGAPSMRIRTLVDSSGRALIGGEAASIESVSIAREPLPEGQGADLRGVWSRRYEHAYENYAFSEEPPPMTPWAQARFQASRPVFGPDNVAVVDTNDPVYKCLPPGVPRIYAHPSPFEIFQFPDRVLIVYEYHHQVRHIFTDGRGHRSGRPAAWMGESVGRWEQGHACRGIGQLYRQDLDRPSRSSQQRSATRGGAISSGHRWTTDPGSVGRRSGCVYRAVDGTKSIRFGELADRGERLYG